MAFMAVRLLVAALLASSGGAMHKPKGSSPDAAAASDAALKALPHAHGHRQAHRHTPHPEWAKLNSSGLCALPKLNASVPLGLLEPLRAHHDTAAQAHRRELPPCAPEDHQGRHAAWLRLIYGQPPGQLQAAFVRHLHGIAPDPAAAAVERPPQGHAPPPTELSSWCVAAGRCQRSELTAPTTTPQRVVVLAVGQLRTFAKPEVFGSHRHFVVDPLRSYGHLVNYVLCIHRDDPEVDQRALAAVQADWALRVTAHTADSHFKACHRAVASRARPESEGDGNGPALGPYDWWVRVRPDAIFLAPAPPIPSYGRAIFAPINPLSDLQKVPWRCEVTSHHLDAFHEVGTAKCPSCEGKVEGDGKYPFCKGGKQHRDVAHPCVTFSDQVRGCDCEFSTERMCQTVS